MSERRLSRQRKADYEAVLRDFSLGGEFEPSLDLARNLAAALRRSRGLAREMTARFDAERAKPIMRVIRERILGRNA